MATSYLPTRDWPALKGLFQYALTFATLQDVEDNIPNNPGIASNLSIWSDLIESGLIRNKFPQYSDVIELMVYPGRVTDSKTEQFRRYRVLTCTVGVICIADRGDTSLCPLNYLVCLLLQDERALADPELTEVLIAAFEELWKKFRSDPWEEQHLFCLLATILLRMERGDAPESLREPAKLLLADESDVRSKCRETDRFLLGTTNYDTYHDEWASLVAEIIPSDSSVEELTLIRQAILSD